MLRRFHDYLWIMMIRTFIWLMLIICPTNSFLQNLQNYTSENFTINNGLPSNEIFHCIQDYEGYLWFATSNGISKFNGNKFENYSILDGLPQNQVYRFYLQDDSSIVGECRNSQYFLFKNDEITPFSLNEQLDSLIPSRTFSHSYCKKPNGDQMFGTRSGLFIFDKDDQLIARDSIPKGVNMEIGYELVDKYVFTYTSWGVSSQENPILNDSFQVVNRNLDKRNAVDINPMYSGYNSMYGSLIDSNHIAISIGLNVVISDLNQNRELEIIEESKSIVGVFSIDSVLWLCCIQHGLIGYRKIDDKYTRTQQLFDGSTVTSILKDKNGSYWITTTNKGVYFINPKLSSTQKLIDFPHRPSAIFKNEKKLIIGFENGDLFINQDKKSMTGDLMINTITEIDDTIFIASDLVYFINGNDDPQLWDEMLGKKRFRASKVLRLNDSILIGSYYSKIYLFNKEGLCLSKLTSIDDNNRISQIKVNTESLYCASENQLFIIDPQSDSLIFQGSCSGIVVELIEMDDRIVTLTENGDLFIYANNEFLRFTLPKADGVFKYYCADYADNTLVISNNNGIYYWDLTELNNIQMTHFEPREEVFHMTTFNDTLYFVSSEELGIKSLSSNTLFLPQVELENIQMDEEILKPNSEYDFRHYQNDILFSLSTISTELPLMNYKYKLKGVDKKFHVSQANEIQYSSLNPGTYKFIFSGTSDGINYSRQQSVLISIAKPYWKENWFIILLIVLIVSAVTMILAWRTKRIRNRLEIEKTLSELKTQALVAQLNPHLIFNVLNSIQGLVSDGEIEKSNKYISRFAKFMRASMNMSRSAYVPLDEELRLTKLYIALEKLRFENQIKFDFQFDDSGLSIILPPLILQPFIENAIKHGLIPSTISDKKVIISVFALDHHYCVSIEDNGVGFQHSFDESMGDGLRISVERLKSINQKNYIELANTQSPTKILLHIFS